MRYLTVLVVMCGCSSASSAPTVSSDASLRAEPGLVSSRPIDMGAVSAIAPRKRGWCRYPDSDGNCPHDEPLLRMPDKKVCLSRVNTPTCRAAGRWTHVGSVRAWEYLEVVPDDER
jgi:hypothetical protein